ncbi:unnamed protein product [Paramecium pentaurelia]|uniref:Calcium-dependent protein kinase n=1 Tax=Paramecium pentaurelia TaxID=43138 RepID=A0A8S1WPB1_9CILI|nr:unnamed protein product [Paramecium pentaurelia]
MGSTFTCQGQKKEKKKNAEYLFVIIDNQELHILLMIYRDLSDRSQNHLICRDTFNTYFKIIGIWGEQIFNKFTHKQEDYMSFEEFLTGLQMYIKCSEDQKIKNLFKLYDLKNQNGIAKTDFLQMLHNYSKEEIKVILNDQLFLEEQQIISAYHRTKKLKPRKGSEDLLKMSLQMFRKYSNISENREFNQNDHQNHLQVDGLQSVHSRQSIDQIFTLDSKAQINGIPMKGFGINLQFQVNGQKIEMQANLNLLIKKYVEMVYKAKNDLPINLEDFTSFVKQHPNLITPLYCVFNFDVWGVQNNIPKYKSLPLDIQGELYRISKKNKIKTKFCQLYPNIFMEFQKKNDIKPTKIVCLSGLIIEERVDHINQKFGFEIFHKNSHYKHKIYNCSDEISYREWQRALSLYFNGEVNKKYSIFDKIGEGKYSIVYRCQSKIDKQFYALKIINKINLPQEEQDIVKHEISITKLLNHSCIIKLIDSIENRDQIHIITELIEDGDLFDYVQNKQYLDEGEAALIFNQLLDALSYIHSIGIVHRDIKPENILMILDKNTVKQIKLIDFGLANHLSKIQKNNEHQNYHCGTCNYQAPEMLQFQEITFSVDVFALGVILYYMLSGYLPFDSDIPQEIIQNTIDGIYSMEDYNWQCVSEEAKDLIVGLLQNQPSKRLTLKEAQEHIWIKNHMAKNNK